MPVAADVSGILAVFSLLTGAWGLLAPSPCRT